MIHLPVCCNGKEEYSNICLAECDGFKESECTLGPCQNYCACPRIYDPQCCNGQDYNSICEAECNDIDTKDCQEGTCLVIYSRFMLTKLIDLLFKLICFI